MLDNSKETFFNSFYIDTKDKVSGTYNDYILNPPGCVNFKGLAVKKVSMTWNVYNVQALNASFSVLYNSVTYNLVLASGNYNASNLLTELKTKLQTIDASFNVTYDSLTSKYTITATLAFSLLLANNPRFASLIGLETINTVAATSLTSTYPINIQFTQYFDITSERILEFADSSYPSNKKLSKILKRVYVNDVQPFANINIIYDFPRIFSYSVESKFPFIDIKIYDMYGVLLDTNNCNLSIQIDIYK
jgi:hypothetical protein